MHGAIVKMDLQCFRKYCHGFINDIDSKWWRM